MSLKIEQAIVMLSYMREKSLLSSPSTENLRANYEVVTGVRHRQIRFWQQIHVMNTLMLTRDWTSKIILYGRLIKKQ